MVTDLLAALPRDLLLSPWLLGLLGLLTGSFLNVVIHRLPRMLERTWWADAAGLLSDGESFGRVFGTRAPGRLAEEAGRLDGLLQALPPLGLARPGSRCPACGHGIRWHENIPVLSWFALRGRCSACQTRIPVRYPLVEALTGLLFAALAWRHGPQPVVLLWCAFAATLVALAVIDWDTTVLPDSMTLPLLWAGLLAAAAGWLPGLTPAGALAGAALGYLSLWTVYQAHRLVTGKEGMGHGDFKLLGALGAWLGAGAILPIVLGASVVGAVVGLGMKYAGVLREDRYVPFGPFLAGSGLAVMLVGTPRVLGWLGWA